jgi:hypothetical protein
LKKRFTVVDFLREVSTGATKIRNRVDALRIRCLAGERMTSLMESRAVVEATTDLR